VLDLRNEPDGAASSAEHPLLGLPKRSIGA
jgi:hypothetical protein